MAVKSAKNATAEFGGSPTTIADVTDVTVTNSQDENKYASSSTSGEYRRTAGHGDITGSFTILADAMPAGLTIGTTITSLVITSDGTVELFNDDAYISNITYNVPVGGGGNVSATVTFARNG